MGQKTKQAITKELHDAKYFSVIVGSTPDLSHVNQYTFIFRFVSKTGSNPRKCSTIWPITRRTGESLADCVVSIGHELGLDLANCRGQSYDNVSNMFRKYNG